MNEKHPALETLEDLIRIQSVNPFFGEEARGEGEVADYVEHRCRQAGLEVYRQPVSAGRENVIAELRVGRPDNALLFEAHMDTVPLGSMENPLEPTYSNNRLYGRGACDTKGSLAAMLHAIEECAMDPERLSSDVILCASVDEERAFEGILTFIGSDIPVAGAVVGEPTGLGIVVAHKGCARFRLTTRGRAAHSSVPHEGDNAIYQMAEVLRVIERDIGTELASLHHPLAGPATLVVATISGGSQINIVPEECAIEVDRRVIPGEDAREVLIGMQDTLQEGLRDSGVDFDVEELLLDWALDTSPESAVARRAQQVASELGLDDSLHGVAYGSDASKLQQLGGVPSIVFGPGSIAQAHSREEWVSVEHVGRAAEFYAGMARDFGRADDSA